MTLTTVSQNLCFGGVQGVYSHASPETGCTMRFGLFLPPQAKDGLVPVLYWLSGLTCTEENFIVKAGAQRVAAELGLAIVAPDTSPRGEGVPDDKDSYDFGQGAGFYVDATQEPWRKHFRMYSYLTEELPWLVASNFAVDPARAGIFGHSMADMARWCWRCAIRSASSRRRPSRRSSRRCAAPGARRRSPLSR